MQPDRRRLLGVLAAVAVAGCGGPSPPGEDADYDVGMSAARFQPPTVEIQAGDTVVWKNTSSHAHTVTARDDGIPVEATYFASGEFDSAEAAEDGYFDGLEGSIHDGETFSHTFEAPGTYEYYCIPHESAGMTGVVQVQE